MKALYSLSFTCSTCSSVRCLLGSSSSSPFVFLWKKNRKWWLFVILYENRGSGWENTVTAECANAFRYMQTINNYVLFISFAFMYLYSGYYQIVKGKQMSSVKFLTFFRTKWPISVTYEKYMYHCHIEWIIFINQSFKMMKHCSIYSYIQNMCLHKW